ncbi:hypothetical protein B0H11DRAFT_437643 [Mycena galericulata]|nr:hypothetical protein B0H11DRAFT_437643 [Mycena galericulata]
MIMISYTGLHILCRAIAGDAFHDSVERYPQPQCHPDTRTKLLDVLYKWACGTEPPRNWTSEDDEDEDSESESESEDENDDASVADKPSSSILWLHGPAGSGKSAVAQSFCQRLQAEGRLGGSFFFKRGHVSRGNASKLFATIAYQLAIIYPELNHAISQTVERDPAIVNRSLSNQLQALIIEPCRRTPLTHPLVVVIDGLDECEGQDIQQEILRVIATVTREQLLPVKFFIASRSEAHISEVFNEPALDGFHCALNIRQSFEDVRKYLLNEFKRIHREHRTIATISRPWPSSEVMEDLVRNSSGYFIYASTIIKYIGDKNFRPSDRLEIIQGIKERGLASPFDMLDQLYIHTLSDVPLDSRPRLLQILVIINSDSLLSFSPSFSKVEQFLELCPGDVRLVLRNLHSVINVPDKDSDNFHNITVHHASFLDFLRDPARSGPFYIGGFQHCMDLLRYIFKALAHKCDYTSQTHIGHYSWNLALSVFQLKYISSAQLPRDFLPLLLNINPDFLFYGLEEETRQYFAWFNLGADLPLWNDYQFMLQCEEVWWACSKELTTEQDSRNHREVWSQVSPQLIRILRAFMVFPEGTICILFHLHHFLDLSWDEMRAIICPLRALVGEDEQQLRELFAFASDRTFIAEPNFHSIIRELALGGLHVMTGVISDKIYMGINMPPSYPCGFFLRFCGPAADFLNALEAFEIAWASRESSTYYLRIYAINHIHNLSQWFKRFPPLEVLTRLELRLKPLGGPSQYLDPELEWIQWLEEHSKYLGCFTETSPS